MKKYRFFMERRLVGVPRAYEALQSFKEGASLTLSLTLEQGGSTFEFQVKKVGEEVNPLYPDQHDVLVAVGLVTKQPPHELLELAYAIRIKPDGSAGFGTAAAVERE